MNRIHALIAAAAVAVSSVVAAAPPYRSIAIETGDLDLNSEKGQRILALRIQRAARAVCEAQAVDSLPQNMRSMRRCTRNAQANAAAAVKTLTAARERYSQRGG